MFKRFLAASILIIGVIAIHRVDVDAHLAGYIYDGTWQHIASYNCVGNFRQVPQNHPALFECEAFITDLQYVCANPQGVETEGNNVRTDITSIGGTSFNALDVKENGTATAIVRMPESAKEFADLQCKLRNRRWHVARELVLKVDVLLKTFDLVCANKGSCTNPTVRVAASQSWVHCDRPFNVNGFLDLITNPPTGGGVPTPYPCFVVQEVHCDREIGCPIDVDPSQFALRKQPYNLNAGINSLWNLGRRALRSAIQHDRLVS